MRRSLLMTAVLLAALFAFTPSVSAGHHYFGDANPVMNRLNRRLGIGWQESECLISREYCAEAAKV